MSLGRLSKSKVQVAEANRRAAATMKRLSLVRHAKSDWSLPGQEDWDRALNKRGQQDAPEMARRMRARKLKPELILTSPAVRALATASIMARELKVPPEHIAQDERLYLADPAQMLEVIRELGGHVAHLMVFGHNPGITEFANKLSSGEHIDNLPTCGIFTACFDVADWSRLDWKSGIDVDFDYPRNLATRD
jgi:phosphohistidine phosphatase